MPTETTAAAKETWLDALPPDAPEQTDLISREELVRRLADRGVTVTANDFRYWQAEGILPLPIKRWYEGATRALYPSWMVNVIAVLFRIREQGRTLRSLGPDVRRLMARLSGSPSAQPFALPGTFGLGTDDEPAPVVGAYVLDELAKSLSLLLAMDTGFSAGRPKYVRAEVRLFTEDGEWVGLEFPPRSTPWDGPPVE